MIRSSLKPLSLAVVAALTLVACGNEQPATDASTAAPTAAAPAAPAAPQALTLDNAALPALPAFQASDLDPAVSACADLNGYVNSKWLAANPVPADRTTWGSFEMLGERSLGVQKQIVEKLAVKKDVAGVEKVIGDFWATGMDQAAIDEHEAEEDHDDADDLTQETFIKAWQALETFRGDAQLFTWLYRIATNECLNFLNKKRRRFFMSINDVEGELLEKLESAAGHADYPMAGDEIQLKLQKALLTLPEKQRLVFNMKYFDDLKYEDIADITGTSVGALKASYHHAVTKIEKFLNGED